MAPKRQGRQRVWERREKSELREVINRLDASMYCRIQYIPYPHTPQGRENTAAFGRRYPSEMENNMTFIIVSLSIGLSILFVAGLMDR